MPAAPTGTPTSSPSPEQYHSVVIAAVEELARSSCVPIDVLLPPGTTEFPPASRDVFSAHATAWAKHFERHRKLWEAAFKELASALDTATAGVSTLKPTPSSTPPETTAWEEPSTSPRNPARAA